MIFPLLAGAAALVFEQGGVMYNPSRNDPMELPYEPIKKCLDRHNLTAVLELKGSIVYVWLYEDHCETDMQLAAIDCVRAYTNNKSVSIMGHNTYEDIRGSDVGSELEAYIGSFPDYEPTWFVPSDEDEWGMPQP